MSEFSLKSQWSDFYGKNDFKWSDFYGKIQFRERQLENGFDL